MTTRRRNGTTLVELLVAMPLALLAATAVAMLLIRIARTARTQSAALAGARELRHARLVLAADLEPLRGTDLLEVSDTVITLRAPLGVALLCAAPAPHVVDVVVPPASHDVWVAAVRSGDELHAWVAGSAPTAAPLAVRRTVVAAPASLGAQRCGADSMVHSQKWRITLGDSTTRLLHGAPVSVHRLARYRHYRSADGWWLGRQSWDGVQWDGVQPVAGPLLTPALGGVRVSALADDGSAIAIAPTTPDSVRQRIALLRVALRRPRRFREVGGPTVDSADMVLPLRGTTRRELP